MTIAHRAVRAAATLLVIGALGLVACGRYGPPIREKKPAPSAEEQTAPPPTPPPTLDPSS
jgi:hypothetical protein